MVAERTGVGLVRAALGADPRVGTRHLALAMADGVLVMEGEVQDVAAKKVALELAAAVPGVHHIVDRIRIRPARSMTDGEIRDHLANALLAEPSFQRLGLRCRNGRDTRTLHQGDTASGAIEIEVVSGVVTLSGEVPSHAHKRLAGVLAWWVPGTRDVVNGLDVVPREADTDDEIADAVRIALEKDPLVEPGGIRVSVHGAVVTLEGAVSSPPQREMAEADAWYVFGVDQVRNRLEIAPIRSP